MQNNPKRKSKQSKRWRNKRVGREMNCQGSLMKWS